MADVTVTIKGLKELNAFLEQAGKKPALDAGRVGVDKALSRLQVYLKRAARYRTGKLRSIIQKRMMNYAALGFVGLYTRAAGIYYTTEFGRGPHRRLGKPRSGSPQMATYWFHKALSAHQHEVTEKLVTETRKALQSNYRKLISATGAPVKQRGGSR